MKIKIYKCGQCKKHKQYSGTRRGLRQHLKEEHLIKSELANVKTLVNDRFAKQSWWITEEVQ